MPSRGFEPSTPDQPRSGQYLPVTGFTETEGGGELEIRLTQCGTCFAAVAETALADHEGTHAGSGPKR